MAVECAGTTRKLPAPAVGRLGGLVGPVVHVSMAVDIPADPLPATCGMMMEPKSAHPSPSRPSRITPSACSIVLKRSSSSSSSACAVDEAHASAHRASCTLVTRRAS
eukprot:scaffold48005_cov31-Tisochrysis_lutea.AAC.10